MILWDSVSESVVHKQLTRKRPCARWLISDIMRHHWLLLGACGWVLLILMFASKFINFPFRRPDDYGGKPKSISATVATPGDIQLQLVDKKRIPTEGLLTAKPLPVDYEDWEAVQAGRLDRLSRLCSNDSLKNLTHTPITKFILDRIFVCDKHKILFCQTPKVGNTQWKKVLIVLNGAFSSVDKIPENVIHHHDKNGLPRLSSLNESEILKRLNSYFKFFIVRDPFERLISAFKDKFVQNPRSEPWYKHDIAPAIMRKYRRNHSEAKGLQFEDFVRYLGDPNHKRLDRQFGDHIIHWITYVELCAPCDIVYNAIGHHETLERDAPYILKAAGIDHLVSYPTIPPGITLYNKTKVEQYFSGIGKRDIQRLYARFQGDFTLFGYKKPDFLLD
ncbi:carbohydrate sulfotransferase 10 isoform X1 [Erpetoichthys calabaricus]|uniref:Carbohydrate sulfotransferase n=3 Tax=Polypteridae TaxID=8289 RepID=A0A8C4RZV3_ERPCA|nr:carbohydrate sulfotransferase 10 isoform X1 [Erpetoichthys calabaricus]